MEPGECRFPAHIAAADTAFASVPLLARLAISIPSADGQPCFFLGIWESVEALLSESFGRIEAV